MATSSTLTQHPPASLWEVISLSFPFIFVLFSGSLMGLCDRLILSHYSLDAVEASVSALYLLQLFQIPTMRIASTAQIFVGQHKGAGQDSQIGPAVWQMIWFSLFSIILVGPLSWPISQVFFQNTTIQDLGIPYFRTMISANFLFPLGAALASFYLGQGQTRRVLLASLSSHALHILLDVPLIFGVKGLISPMGIEGAALSAIAAQLFFCALLFRDFLSPLNKRMYNTMNASFDWHSFWNGLRIGFPRAGSKIVLLVAWAAVTHIIIHKSEDYLAILAFGGTINLFYTCFNEGLSQALTTIGAYLIGAKKLLIWKLTRSAFLFVFLGAFLLAIPCLIFPDSIIAMFFKEQPSIALRQELYLSCYWLWLLFVAHGMNLIFLGILNAYGDTMFQMLFSLTIGWMTHFLPVYFILGQWNGAPNQLWLIMVFVCLASAAAYFLRLRQEKWRTNDNFATKI